MDMEKFTPLEGLMKLLDSTSRKPIVHKIPKSYKKQYQEVFKKLDIDEDYQYEGLTQLIITKDMAERKTKMIELGNAFIAFPGGVGTLEEVSEIMSKISLGHLQAPCIYYNLDGYYDDIKHFLQQMIAKGFSSEEKQQGVYFAESLEKIKELLK